MLNTFSFYPWLLFSPVIAGNLLGTEQRHQTNVTSPRTYRAKLRQKPQIRTHIK